MIRLLLVDDHPIVLSGLAALAASDPHLEVVGTAGSVADAMALPHETRPDVGVLDLHLPDGDGIALGVALKRRWPGTRVVVLTMAADASAVIRSIGTGLDGYLLKDSDPEDLLAAIHTAAGGALVLGRGASEPVIAAAAAAPRDDPLAALDARDREILDLISSGLPTSQVAAKLFLAPKTIRNRTSVILGKLGVTTKDEAITLGRKGGLGSR